MAEGIASTVVIEDFDVYVTRVLLAELRRGVRLTETARRIAELDVSEELGWLAQRGALLVMPSPNLPDSVVQMARSESISEYDASCVALAEALQRSLDIPLIVADRDLYGTLQRRPRLRVMWLGDYG
jgi:predicted nucleic acid-binding protein